MSTLTRHETRDKFVAALATLRKSGIAACRGANDAWETVQHEAKRPFTYTRRGADKVLDDPERHWREGYPNSVYLNYAGVDGVEGALTDEQVGQRVLDAMLAAGLDATWSGETHDAVVVRVPQP